MLPLNRRRCHGFLLTLLFTSLVLLVGCLAATTHLLTSRHGAALALHYWSLFFAITHSVIVTLSQFRIDTIVTLSHHHIMPGMPTFTQVITQVREACKNSKDARRQVWKLSGPTMPAHRIAHNIITTKPGKATWESADRCQTMHAIRPF